MTTAIAPKPTQNGATAPAPSTELTSILAAKYSLSRDVFLNTVVTMCFPPNSKPSNAELCSFLLVCKEQDLNPILREIYAFPKKGGGIQVIVGVDGWLKIANRHPAFDGMVFQDAVGPDGSVMAIKATIFRKDRNNPTEAIEYLSECRRGTDPWRQMPLRMLRNRAICQAVRIAFGVSGVMNEDEFQRWQELTVMTTTAHDPQRRIGRSQLNDRLLGHSPATEAAGTHTPTTSYVTPDGRDPADTVPDEEPQASHGQHVADPMDPLRSACQEAYEQGDLAAFGRLSDEWCGPDARWTEDENQFAEAGKMIAEFRDRLAGSPSAKAGKPKQKQAFDTAASATEQGH